jgi:hypothetical protein
MIKSKIKKIYRIDGMKNSTIIETDTGLFEIQGNGFFKTTENALLGHEVFSKVNLSGLVIVEVKCSMEFTVIKLSSGDFIVHHVDTPFIKVELHDEIKKDKEFLDWFENDLTQLTNERHYTTVE